MRPHSRLRSYQSKRFIERKNTRVFLGIGLLLTCVALWLYSLSTFSFLNAFTIVNIRVIGADRSIVPSVQNSATDLLQGKYLGLFSKANIFLYPHDLVANSIQSEFPRIESLSVKRDGLQGLKVEVVEKNPVALVCATLPDFSEDNLSFNNYNNCYEVDSTGLIFNNFSLATSTSLNLYYIPVLADLATTSKAAIGSYATSTGEFVALQDFYNGTRKAGLRPLAILAKENGEYEMYVENVVIYFNNSRSFGEQLLNLVSFWNRVVVPKNGENTSASFESIDVRYGSNVFYRKIK